MRPVRQTIGGLGNLMFKEAFITSLMLNGSIPDTYVQDFHYWDIHKDYIKQKFGGGLTQDPRISLQIRRGDYLKANNFYVDLSITNYYQEAIKNFPNERFLVFCFDRQDPEQDKKDREWTIEFLDSFIKGRYDMHDPAEETEDMNAMSSCAGNIIANSTFGWWAAYLNGDDTKKVVCPKNWFSDGYQRCILPDNWILL